MSTELAVMGIDGPLENRLWRLPDKCTGFYYPILLSPEKRYRFIGESIEYDIIMYYVHKFALGSYIYQLTSIHFLPTLDRSKIVDMIVDFGQSNSIRTKMR